MTSEAPHVQDVLRRIARRFSESDSPFHRTVMEILESPFQEDRFATLRPLKSQLIEVLGAYFRSPSFIVRYLPLEDPAIRRSWLEGERGAVVLRPALDALRSCILYHFDRSQQTLMGRIHQFLEYAVELAEVSAEGDPMANEEEAGGPLLECLNAVATFARERPLQDPDGEDTPDGPDQDDGRYRVVPLVRMVYGDTPSATRERLALAFNSPLFPEVLVSSVVMGEGIDLHRFCRHVIHHDGYWNPSTLEQQTGRLDRIRCKAEVCGLPIHVYQPFIAGSADEKMFRVLRDRERWFQVVMGQRFEFDEATSEAVATRVPLPEELAKPLTFDLSRWTPTTVGAGDQGTVGQGHSTR
jgi:hypothetical protein